MSSKEGIDYIKDYFRNEKISFKSWPVFWVLRIVFAALILISFNVQCFLMIMGASFQWDSLTIQKWKKYCRFRMKI